MKQPKAPPRLLNAQESAILLLRLIELRNEEAQAATRVRLSELTLRRLWGRNRLNAEFLEEVQEWLSRGGWSLFFAKTTYGVIRTSAVLNWARVSSKRLSDEMDLIHQGEFDFQKHIHLICDDEGSYSDD